MSWRREHTIIVIIKITEVLGFSLILPFLPFYAQELGANAFQVGLMLMTFSLFQFFSAPIMGKLSDIYGRRPLLIISQLSTLAGFIILAFSGNLWMLFLSRIIDGLFGSNYTIAQAYLSDITPKKDRTRVYSLTGIAFSIGFFIGPAVGGYLSKFGYAVPSMLAAIMTVITIITTYLYLPETIIKNKQKFVWNWKILGFKKFKLLFDSPQISLPLWEYFFYVLTHGIWVSSFSLYAERQLHLNAEDIGYVFAMIGAINIVIRSLIMPRLLHLLDENKLRFLGAISVMIAMSSAPFLTNRLHLILSTIFFAFGSATIRPSLTAHISNMANKNKRGETMGIVDSLGSVSQILGPLVGGFLMNSFFPGSLGLAAATMMAISLIFLIKEQRVLTQSHKTVL